MSGFADFVAQQAAAGRLVVQPRMGFATPEEMRAGLIATKSAAATTVGTVTVDSYTRVGDLAAARTALRRGAGLNGYPLATHDAATTRRMLDGVRDDTFPVQVRHGSAAPQHIFAASLRAGLDATEGGPVSYCLPYGRVPLEVSVRNWAAACRLLARTRDLGARPHLETFGGCMLGQLCPPGQLVAISVLEALFFRQHGLDDVSVSYAQQANADQDREAVLALRRLCTELLTPLGIEWHVVVYAYMGVYPTTDEGAHRLLARAAELAVTTGAPRLIVKTVAESRRIPTVRENVAALEHAAAAARSAAGPHDATADSQTYAEARALIDAVLGLGPDLGDALVTAFRRGLLDIPFCLHPDNAGRSRSYLDADGRLRWAELGSLPLRHLVGTRAARPVTSTELLGALAFVRHRYDREALEASPTRRLT
ncbi:methylaspartate mutase [Streptomyces ardesiacus]|uniref:methylaspartate mutase n=1 Tax=Streptomyces ardesiacus TaxID=285564 RepID=UPI003817F61C